MVILGYHASSQQRLQHITLDGRQGRVTAGNNKLIIYHMAKEEMCFKNLILVSPYKILD